jgi:Ca2+-binding EF-hand superfamily protein
MRILFNLLTTLLVVAGVVAPSLAADKPKPTPEDTFKKLDADSDGALTETEFVGKRKGDAAAKATLAFKKMDKDSDGKVTLEEFKTKGKKAK